MSQNITHFHGQFFLKKIVLTDKKYFVEACRHTQKKPKALFQAPAPAVHPQQLHQGGGRQVLPPVRAAGAAPARPRGGGVCPQAGHPLYPLHPLHPSIPSCVFEPCVSISQAVLLMAPNTSPNDRTSSHSPNSPHSPHLSPSHYLTPKHSISFNSSPFRFLQTHQSIVLLETFCRNKIITEFSLSDLHVYMFGHWVNLDMEIRGNKQENLG